MKKIILILILMASLQAKEIYNCGLFNIVMKDSKLIILSNTNKHSFLYFFKSVNKNIYINIKSSVYKEKNTFVINFNTPEAKLYTCDLLSIK
jgi:hypothetical protein